MIYIMPLTYDNGHARESVKCCIFSALLFLFFIYLIILIIITKGKYVIVKFCAIMIQIFKYNFLYILKQEIKYK